MSNEILLILSLLLTYTTVVLLYKFLNVNGLYMFTVIATIAANIEALIVINAFGMEQTLGNILFASTFLITDILSELEGKKAAKRAVNIGIITSFIFIVLSQSWLLYTPNSSDFAMPAITEIFSNTPRMMISSFLVYAIAQRFDVWAYHKWWALTKKISGDEKKFLWLRNNGSTLVSQLINTVLFTFGAFYGRYSMKTLISICISSYVIFIVTSFADTPAVYVARKLKEKNMINEL